MGALRYRVRYGSYRALDADHAAYLSHGGFVMPVGGDVAAAPNSPLVMELEGPDGQRFDLLARSGQPIPEQGFMLSFEAAASDAQALLERYVTSDAFRTARDAEPEDASAPPEVALAPTPTLADRGPAPDGPARAEAAEGDALDRPAEALSDDAEPPPLSEDAASPHADPSPDEAPRVDAGADEGETAIAPPPAGSDYPVFVVKYDQVTPWDAVVASFDANRALDVPVAEPTFAAGDLALLRLTLPGRNVFEMWARIAAKHEGSVTLQVGSGDEQYRKAVLYAGSPSARSRREREAKEEPMPVQALRIEASIPQEDTTRMPIRRRLQRMGMDEKINLALTGNRQERMALATDSNKAVHHYLLKNTKITLDEIATMARLPSLNPDVLEKIAENPQYTQNPSVAKALVYNPKTPVRTAVRILDRLPRNEVGLLAKRTNLNPRLVNAAKKKIGETP